MSQRSSRERAASARAASAQSAAAGAVPPKALVIILLTALAVRVAYYLTSRSCPSFEPLLLDPAYYHRWALRIVGGDWVGEGVFYGLPLYPYFLAAILAVSGLSLAAVKAAQIALGLGALYFVYRTGEKLGGRPTGLLAAALGAVYGPLFFYESLVIPEALGVTLYAAALYLLLAYLEKRTVASAARLGAVAGLATLTKAGILLFIVVLAVWGLLRGKGRPGGAKAPAVLFLAYWAVLLPVTAHNAYYGKDTVLLSSHSGFNFYVGNNPAAEGVFKAPPGVGTNVESQARDARLIAESAVGRPLKPSEVSKYWSAQAWAYIRQNPLDAASLWLRKFALFHDAREISDVQDYAFERNFNSMLRLPWLDFGWIVPLVFVGGLYAVRSGGAAGRSAVLWVLGYTAAVCLYFVNARYRVPLLPAYLVLAAYGVTRLWRDARSGRWMMLTLAVVIGAAGFGLSQMRLVGTPRTSQWVNTGDVFMKQQRFAEAERCYRKALELDGRFAKAYLALGTLMNKQGLYEQAKDYFMSCLAIEPHVDALNNVGLWYDANGDGETAERYFKDALQLGESSQAHNNLGMVYGKRGENARALEHFEASLRINPDSARAWTNRGLVLYRLGRRAEAVDSWRRALGIDPEFGEARKALEYIQSSPSASPAS